MLDDLAGKRTGERIQILRERRGLSRPVLAGLVGMSASWLKGIERGTRLGYWQAQIPEAAGETVITRYTLRELLDKLDELIAS